MPEINYYIFRYLCYSKLYYYIILFIIRGLVTYIDSYDFWPSITRISDYYYYIANILYTTIKERIHSL